MTSRSNLHTLVERFAARIEVLHLSGHHQEEYSTMLRRLEEQAERRHPDSNIVDECLAYLDRFTVRAA